MDCVFLNPLFEPLQGKLMDMQNISKSVEQFCPCGSEFNRQFRRPFLGLTLLQFMEVIS
jgi:hypothetical protein